MIRIKRREVSDEQLTQIIQAFEKFKAESDDAIINNENVFVRTPAFETLDQHRISRTNTLLLGRKGDGKTAILRKMQKEIRDNPAPGQIELFSWINMEDTYFSELVGKFDQLSEQIKRENPRISAAHISSKIWQKFIKLSSLQIFLNHCEKDENISDQIKKRYMKDLDELREMISVELGVQAIYLRSNDIGSNFISFLQRLKDLIVISDRFVARDVDKKEKLSINSVDILRDLGNEFENWAQIISDLKIFVTLALDRFDDFVDNLVSDDLIETRRIRREFLHGLVPAITSLDTARSYSWLRVVASLPEDLIVDMKLREIASHRKLHFVEIYWSIADLRSILDGRVSSIIPGIEFEDIFSYHVSNRNSLVLTKESASEYLIRHTTRRPREVMAHAVSLFELIRDKKKIIEARDYGSSIAESNISIVNDQIIPEWNSVLPLLKSFFHSMNRRSPKTVFTLADFEQWDQAFNPISLKEYGGRRLSTEERSMTALAALFRIGVLGFRVRRATKKKGYLKQGEVEFVRYVFSYSKIRDPISDIVDFILAPNLPDLVEKDEGKLHRATLAGQRDGHYDIALCFSPMFFESLEAEHDVPYVIDECNEGED